MTDILKRLQAATGSDGRLDCEIREAVEGWKNIGGGWRKWPDGRQEQYNYGYAEPYTASIDAAMALVEMALPGCDLSMGYFHSEGKWRFFIGTKASVKAPTLPLAILTALFTALEAKP